MAMGHRQGSKYLTSGRVVVLRDEVGELVHAHKILKID